jgi:hypothetical protein
MTSFTPFVARSRSDVIPAGFDAGKINTSRFVQKILYGSICFALASSSAYLVLAPAKTSAGAPCWIWAAS